MTFSIRTLRRILHARAGIAPRRIDILSDFRHDLGLTDWQIEQVLTDITLITGLTFPADTAEHLTDVFDLLIHVMLRLPETYDADYYYGPLPSRVTEKLSLTNNALTLVAFGGTHLN